MQSIEGKERYYSNKIFVKQNAQDLERLLDTKYAGEITYKLNTSIRSRSNNTAYYDVEFVNLAENDMYKNVVVRIGDYPQEFDEFMPHCSTSKAIFSIAPDETTIDELEEQFDKILGNEEIISVTARKILTGEEETEDDYIMLYRFDADIKAKPGYVTGSSGKGVSSAVRDAFSEGNKDKFPTLSMKEYGELRDCVLGILQEEAEKIRKKCEDADEMEIITIL
ncbi:hypothetical protein [Cloacibacillus sp. An23]|uniref:hypothetical protein n=1 Tax=Cloacibacillus sp. An23 TaxID=1965591 RepID=UPI00117753BE|nr:hypothetical protein [Cloacibacillus sp. An23]